MEQQQNDSAETDAEIGQLSKRIAEFFTLKKLPQNYRTKTEAEIEHLIRVNKVSDIVERYLGEQYFSVTRKRSIMETIMSVVPDNPFAASHPPDGKKDPQETLPENPGAASHPPDGKKDPQGPFTSRKITVMCSDGEVEVDEEVALESQTMKFAIEHNCINFPLPYVTSKVLSKVIEYCKMHVESRKSDDRATDDDLKAWDAEFIKVDQATLFDLIRGADYLEVKSLSILSCKTFLDRCEGKTREEVYKLLKVLMHPL